MRKRLYLVKLGPTNDDISNHEESKQTAIKR